MSDDGKRIDPTKAIEIHLISDGEGRGWVHTHGMLKFNKPELEMRNIPLFLGGAAAGMMNVIAGYILNDGTVSPGDNMRVGPHAVVRFEVAKAPQGLGESTVASHYAEPRFLITDIPMEGHCALCASGIEHDHEESKDDVH